MEILFLGTGAAWSLPEHSCRCAICTEMTKRREDRTRTSLLIRGTQTILVDCGPDLRNHMRRFDLNRPDLVLITHEHGDHYLGMDDLLAFRRSVPKEEWQPIPVYATAEAWKEIEFRFGYLLGSLIEKRVAVPGTPLHEPSARITPFKTFHGPTAAGSVGYVIEDAAPSGVCKLVYTSDFMRLEDEPSWLAEPDLLIIQSHWLNEPVVNRPYHMSFQHAMEYIKRWRPKQATYLVHVSDGDQVPGDPYNGILKKYAPKSRLAEPVSGTPYPVPRCLEEWQDIVNRICTDYTVPGPVIVSWDGLTAAGKASNPLIWPAGTTGPRG